jgi:hypothetical protein
MARFDYNTTYPLRDVMAASVMAYRLNDDEYFTHTVSGLDSNDNYLILKHANKHLMLFTITDATVPNSLKMSVNEGSFWFDNVADEEDYEVADSIISYYTGLMLAAISGKINDFEQRVLNLVKANCVSASNFGIVASLPKSYFRSVERDTVEQQQRELSADSQYVGKIGSTVELAIDVLRCNFIQKLNCHVVNARAGNDLIVFFTSNADDFNGMRCGNIKGRVKRHQTSNYHGGKETVLNYVKKI